MPLPSITIDTAHKPVAELGETALRDLGQLTKPDGLLMAMAIIGGKVITALTRAVSDAADMTWAAMLVPPLCILMIALSGRMHPRDRSSGASARA